MSVDSEYGEAMYKEEDCIESLKQQKVKDKAAFTRIKNKLLSLLDKEEYQSWRKSRRFVNALSSARMHNVNYGRAVSRIFKLQREREKVHQ